MSTRHQARRLAGVVLAAGDGTRLRPLTAVRPKALCPVGGVPLVDLALARLAPVVGTGPAQVAVNAHHLADQLLAHCAGRAQVSVEAPVALGTAGALAALRDWAAGRDLVVTNADAYLPGVDARALVRDWDGERCRLLCVPAAERGDFDQLRYAGICVVPWALLAPLPATPSGLYEVLWRGERQAGRLDLVTAAEGQVFVDCGTPADYLRANLIATGGAPSVGRRAVVEGTVERCVVWDGAVVPAGEHLSDAIRAGDISHPITIRV